jgi:hypothetical protein
MQTGSTVVNVCGCGEGDSESCNIALGAGGRPPDFITIHLGDGFPMIMPFPYVNVGAISLRASVRMAVTGG